MHLRAVRRGHRPPDPNPASSSFCIYLDTALIVTTHRKSPPRQLTAGRAVYGSRMRGVSSCKVRHTGELAGVRTLVSSCAHVRWRSGARQRRGGRGSVPIEMSVCLSFFTINGPLRTGLAHTYAEGGEATDAMSV